MNELGSMLAIILSSGAFLTGLGSAIAVFLNRKTAKETTTVTHSNVVFEGYGELLDRVQTQSDKLDEKVEVMSLTIERQGEEIQSLKMELRDSHDQIRMLTLDRDDLVALVVGPRPNLRTI